MQFSFKVEVPAEFRGRPEGRSLVGGMSRSIMPIMRRIAEQAKADTPWQHVRAGYYVRSSTTSSGWEASINNLYPEHWRYLEEGIPPHAIPPVWAPIGPGSRLRRWAEAHSVNPYAVRWKIGTQGTFHPGTRGEHIFARVWGRGEADLTAATDRAMASWLRRMGTGGGGV